MATPPKIDGSRVESLQAVVGWISEKLENLQSIIQYMENPQSTIRYMEDFKSGIRYMEIAKRYQDAARNLHTLSQYNWFPGTTTFDLFNNRPWPF